MAKKVLKEGLIVVGGTLFLLVLCATAGITINTSPSTSSARADWDEEKLIEAREWSNNSVSATDAESPAHHFVEP